MNPAFKMDGVGGILEVYEDKLAITPTGFIGLMNKGLKGTKTIPYMSITSIQFKKSGLTSGYLQFSIPGGTESRGGVFAAASDENTFMFNGNNEMASKIKDYIESRVQALRTPQATAASSISVADELKKLAEMRAGGILTDEEFQAAKQKLIR